MERKRILVEAARRGEDIDRTHKLIEAVFGGRLGYCLQRTS
jgi:hypothetical protein